MAGPSCLALIFLAHPSLCLVQTGLAAGLLSSMMWLGWQTSRPSWAVLGRRSQTHYGIEYRNVSDYE
eukprot:786701-Pyramimonas_sp.AAC.1